MRTTPALAGLLAMLALVPGAARAETVGTITVGPSTVSVIFAGPGTKTLGVHLERGLGYALTAGGYLPVSLRDATGRTLAVAEIGDDQRGVSFRAPYTGAYFVDITAPADDTFPDGESAGVDIDCMADRTTNCTLPVGTTRTNKLFNYTEDDDWFRTTLSRGRVYVLHIAPEGTEPCFVRVRDAAGTPVTPWGGFDENTGRIVDLVFRAPRDGTYFAEAASDEPPGAVRYSISLRRR